MHLTHVNTSLKARTDTCQHFTDTCQPLPWKQAGRAVQEALRIEGRATQAHDDGWHGCPPCDAGVTLTRSRPSYGSGQGLCRHAWEAPSCAIRSEMSGTRSGGWQYFARERTHGACVRVRTHASKQARQAGRGRGVERCASRCCVGNRALAGALQLASTTLLHRSTRCVS